MSTTTIFTTLEHQKRYQKILAMWKKLGELSASYFSVAELRLLFWQPQITDKEELFNAIENIFNAFNKEGKF